MKKKTVVAEGKKFRKGDAVIMVAGTYPGTTGVFVKYHTDKNWADIKESNGDVRSHPIAWMAHVPAKRTVCFPHFEEQTGQNLTE